MKRNVIYKVCIIVVMTAALFTAISAGLQFKTAQNTHIHAAYATGKVTKLSRDRPYPVYYYRCEFGCTPEYYAHAPGYYVSYSFTPSNSDKTYSKTLYGINKGLYSSLSLGGSIKLYYDVQDPNLNNPEGDESSSGQLAGIALISGAIFIISLTALMVFRHR